MKKTFLVLVFCIFVSAAGWAGEISTWEVDAAFDHGLDRINVDETFASGLGINYAQVDASFGYAAF